MNIALKEIIATAWKHFRIHWLKLVSISFVGYFLPIVALVWFVLNVFFMNPPAETTDSEFFDYDPMFGAILLIPILIMLGIFLIIIAAFCTFCFLLAAKVVTILSMPGLIKISTDIVNNKPISIKKSFSFSSFGKYYAYYLLSFLGLSGVQVFSPFIVAEEPEISLKDSFNKSYQLAASNNFKLVQKCRTICGAINLLGIITMVGLIFAIPFTILIKAEMYKKLKDSCPPPFISPIVERI